MTRPDPLVAATAHMRLAEAADSRGIAQLIDRSVRGLQANDYSAAQIDAALGSVFGVDHRLIEDGAYFLIEVDAQPVACGGWSHRQTLFGAHAHAVRDDSVLIPGVDAARIRAFFVDPQWARCGLGGRLILACEAAAAQAGYRRIELGASLTGVPFYSRFGYRESGREETPLPGGGALTIVRMGKELDGAGPCG